MNMMASDKIKKTIKNYIIITVAAAVYAVAIKLLK